MVFLKRKVSSVVNQMVLEVTGDVSHWWPWAQKQGLTLRTGQLVREPNFLFKVHQRGEEREEKGCGIVSTPKAHGCVRDLKGEILQKKAECSEQDEPQCYEEVTAPLAWVFSYPQLFWASSYIMKSYLERTRSCPISIDFWIPTATLCWLFSKRCRIDHPL